MSWTPQDSLLKLVLETQEAMLKDRGFSEVSSKEEKKGSLPSRLYKKGEEKILVYYLLNKSPLGKADFTAFNEEVGYVAKNNPFQLYKNAILIYPDQGPKTTIGQYIDSYSLNPSFQSFTFKQLTYNPTTRFDSPIASLVPEDELEPLLKELGIIKKQLSIVTSKDAMVKYYGWKSGQVVKIERYLELPCVAPFTIAYRRIT